MREKISYASPINEDNPYIFSAISLKKMIDIWNSVSANKIKLEENSTSKVMYNKIKATLSTNKYWIWCGLIEKQAEKVLSKNLVKLQKIKRDLRAICRKNLKPEKPEAWYRDPKTWLSNWDIQNVMIQYADTQKYKYAFLGVFPIDFAVMSSKGSCIYSSFCIIDLKKYTKKGVKFIGLITNLDKHDQSGSHWTSTFIVIDPKLQTYGAYYYDSTGSPIPSYLQSFLTSVKDQCDKNNPHKPFKVFQNRKQHQKKNTECGVFSMIYQLRWLNKHIVKNNNTSFQEIIANPYIDDDNMLQIRNCLFRPNTNMELKQM
jgi:hypothetical protein